MGHFLGPSFFSVIWLSILLNLGSDWLIAIFDTDKHRGFTNKSKICLTPVRYTHLRHRVRRERQNLESLGMAGLPLRTLRESGRMLFRFMVFV